MFYALAAQIELQCAEQKREKPANKSGQEINKTQLLHTHFSLNMSLWDEWILIYNKQCKLSSSQLRLFSSVSKQQWLEVGYVSS